MSGQGSQGRDYHSRRFAASGASGVLSHLALEFSNAGLISSCNDRARQAVAVYQLLEKSAFGPDDIKCIVSAYERALERLGLQGNQDDSLNQAIAKYVIEVAQTGEKDPAQICTLALKRFVEEFEKRFTSEN